MSSPLIWELDFYSRPIFDANNKRIWELLICTPDRSFCYVKQCPSNTVNSNWLAAELTDIMNTQGVAPVRVRFFPNSMANIISRGCKQAGLSAQASRRLFAMNNWLQERMTNVYPLDPTFQGPDPAPSPTPVVPSPLPDALTADRWQTLSLPAQELEAAIEWDIDFGELFPVHLPPHTEIPGIMMISPRAVAIAAWMSGLDPVFLQFHPTIDRWQLRFDSGADASWIMADIADAKIATTFEAAKQKADGLHFIALQTNPETEKLAGFWLLKQIYP